MRTRLVNPRIERARRAAQRIERHRADHVGGFGQRLRGVKFQTADGQHRLRAVDQADAFLGMQRRSARCRRARSASAPGRIGALEFRLAFADQHQRHVRQRRQIARRAHAALRRNHRRDAAVDQIAQTLGHQRTDAGEAFGQHIGADQHHGAHRIARQRFAHARRSASGSRCAAVDRDPRAECARWPAVPRRC